MPSQYSYSHTFSLDRPHFNECYSQSVADNPSLKTYFKAIVLLVFGMVLILFSDVTPYAAWFVFALGLLEAISIYYRQAWWVTRQMLGKSAKADVTITIDNKGIATESFYIKSMILWENITGFKKTPLGWVIQHELGSNYISDSCLSQEALTLMNEHKLLFNKNKV